MAALPDKWLRKAIYDNVHNMDVNGLSFPCFTDQTGIENPNNYTLLSTQLNTQLSNKCGNGWVNDTQIQVITRVAKNQGSKLLLDDATQALITELETLSLDPGSGLKIITRTINTLNDFSEETDTQIVFRKVVLFQTNIN